MPPRRYLEGFTLCVPLPDDGGGLVDCSFIKRLFIRAEISPARRRTLDLVVRVDIRLMDSSEEPGAEVGESFPTEVHIFPFPASPAERRKRIESIITSQPLIPAG